MLAGIQRELVRFDQIVRWARPEQMHLTLKFLGDVGGGQVEQVRAVVGQALAGLESFELRAERCGCFPPRGKARVVWCGVADSSGVLLSCARRLDEELATVGFAREERAYSPHLTLGRVREDSSNGKLRSAVEQVGVVSVVQGVEKVVLMSSELRPKGARHTVVDEWGLGKR